MLPHSGKVSISLYDINGRIVKEIFSGNMKSGKHTVAVNMERFSSGVYFYRVKFESKIKLGKMIYLK
jgi:hypothetical protein